MNIVFDLGGVVFNWQPDLLARSAFSDRKQQWLTRHEIIGHPDWLELDRGSLSVETAIANASRRTGMSKGDIAEFFANVPSSLTPIQETIDLVHELADKQKVELFVLSNMHHSSVEYLESKYDFWGLFRKCVFSCRIGMVKPEPDIFEYLLESNGLSAQETVFIDDMQENIQAAAAFGIATIQFRDTQSCRDELMTLGCI